MAKKTARSTCKKMCKLEFEARAVIGKLRRGSSLTRNDQLRCISSIGKSMQKYGLNSIRDIKPSHVARYFAELQLKGLSAGRMANHATAMRRLCSMIGKADIVPSNTKLGCSRNIQNRTKNADVRLDVAKYAEVKLKLRESHRICLDLSRHFGLRQKESLVSHKTIVRDGFSYLVVEGAKNGRPREIPIVTLEQKEVIARNIAYRAAHGGKLIDESSSLKQGIKQLQNALSDAGATKSSLSNQHAVRREWIIERCELILSAHESDRQSMLDALVEQVGHGREEVIRAYTRMLG